MITFKTIREYTNFDSIELHTEKSALFYGISHDDRGREVLSYLTSHFKKAYELIYNNDSDTLTVQTSTSLDIKRIHFFAYLQEQLKEIETIYLETTTLGFPELLTILFYISKLEQSYNIYLFYVEPEKYTSKSDDSYDLSEEYSNHKYIKPFIATPIDSSETSETVLISLLGFEENRLGRVLEESENKYNQLISIFPIPGFKYTWENISLSRHHIFLESKSFIYYAAADDPYETYKLLEKISNNLPDNHITLLPIGTKPCSIGVTIFLINNKLKEAHKEIACKYDFPRKKEGRSSGVSKIYVYKLSS